MTTTRDRVPSHTASHVNRRIRQSIEESVIYHREHKDRIARRLDELDREWDIERAIEANAAAISLIGLTFGFLGSRRWFLLPMAVSGFLLQHAVQGWCPPVPVLRRLGFRTSYEIEQERQALKLLRGDYRTVEADALDADRSDQRSAERIIEAVRA
ncbi:MAG: DUF2892 domain-containing protein [Hyphomicrobiales bacterium]|nr:DUF2892 domain-containing protein [Hyphomicrobiales bacterium]